MVRRRIDPRGIQQCLYGVRAFGGRGEWHAAICDSDADRLEEHPDHL
jgi:hypothetical protein